MLSAIVRAGPVPTSRPSRNASTSGRAPCACTPRRRGSLRDESQGPHLLEALPDPRDRAAVAHRYRDPVGHVRARLLADLEAAGLLALDQRGVHGRVPVVPAVAFAGALAQLPRLVVARAHADHARAEHQELRDLRLGRRFGHEDHRGQADARRRSGQRGRRVAGRGAGHHARLLGQRARHADHARAVLEGRGRVPSLVLQAKLLHAGPFREPRRVHDRRPADRERRTPGLLGHREQLAVAPDVVWARRHRAGMKRAPGTLQVEQHVQHPFGTAGRTRPVEPAPIARAAARADETGDGGGGQPFDYRTVESVRRLLLTPGPGEI